MRQEVHTQLSGWFDWSVRLHYKTGHLTFCSHGIKKFLDIGRGYPDELVFTFSSRPLSGSYHISKHPRRGAGMISLDGHGTMVGMQERNYIESMLDEGYKYVRCEYEGS